MKIGFIGLGKMGGNMTKRLITNEHEVLAYDPSESARELAKVNGIEVVDSRDELINSLTEKIIWLMIPSEHVDSEVDALLSTLPAGSIIIDGGNSDFRLSIERSRRCQDKSIMFIDIGTSGGILGLEQGYSMMVGGDTQAVETLRPILDTLAPPKGWQHFGESGSGHYVKMVHNAIEYGLMESYAEGYRLLKDGPFKQLDLAAAGNVWQHGSIIASLLNELSTEALSDNPELDGIDGYVHESGEARWALEIAKEHGIETPAISASFDVRLKSQQGEINFATKLLAAMRNKFGGHTINKDSK
jgi:6-phosphogluconate dehydrogenase